MTPTLIACLLAQAIPGSPEPPPPPAAPPLQMREVFWCDRRGHLQHQPVAFAGERPVEGIELYRLVGRRDLVTEYQRREAMATAVGGVGALSAVAGGIGAVVYQSQRKSCPPDAAGCAPPNATLAALSAVAVLAGGLMMVASAASSPDPLTDDQKRALVDDYNRRLRAPRTSVRPAGAVTSHAALLGVAASF